MSTTVKVQIQQRIDTSSNWTTANPTLLAGEVGWESNTKKYKIGDGSTAWASLAYAPGAGGYTAGTGVSISGSNVISASAVALTTVQTAANQTAHLALTTQEGDIVVRSDENKSYVRNSGSAGSMADFTLLATPTDAVLSVNGNTGAITAAHIAAAVEAASDSNTFTDADHTKLNGIAASANNYAISSDLLDEDDFASDSATKAASQQSIKAYFNANAANTTYAISCVDGDNTDEEKIRLTAGGSGSGTDDVVLEAGTGLSIARSGDKITFTNTISNTDTQLTEEQVEDFVGGMLTGNTETGITVTYQDSDGTIDFVVDSQTDNNFSTYLKNKLDGIASSANNYSISTDLLDEDDFSTNSATKPPSQQSVKAYVDTADALKANLSGATYTGDVVFTGDSSNGLWDKSGNCFLVGTTSASSTDTRLELKNTAAHTEFTIISKNDSGAVINLGDTDSYNQGRIKYDNSNSSLAFRTSATDALTIDSSQNATFAGEIKLSSATAKILGTTADASDNGQININAGGSASQSRGAGDAFYGNEHASLAGKRYVMAGNVTGGDIEFYTGGTVSATIAYDGNTTFAGDVVLADDKRVKIGSGSDLNLYHASNTNYIEVPNAATGDLKIETLGAKSIHLRAGDHATGAHDSLICNSNGSVQLFFDNSARLATSAAGVTVTGTVTDSKGNLRSVPANSPSSDHVATAADAGKVIYIAYDVWFNPSVFSAGDVVTVINNSGNNETIVQGTNFTLYNTSDASTGNRTLAGRGMATVWMAAHNIGYISGAGLS